MVAVIKQGIVIFLLWGPGRLETASSIRSPVCSETIAAVESLMSCPVMIQICEWSEFTGYGRVSWQGEGGARSRRPKTFVRADRMFLLAFGESKIIYGQLAMILSQKQWDTQIECHYVVNRFTVKMNWYCFGCRVYRDTTKVPKLQGQGSLATCILQSTRKKEQPRHLDERGTPLRSNPEQFRAWALHFLSNPLLKHSTTEFSVISKKHKRNSYEERLTTNDCIGTFALHAKAALSTMFKRLVPDRVFLPQMSTFLSNEV